MMIYTDKVKAVLESSDLIPSCSLKVQHISDLSQHYRLADLIPSCSLKVQHISDLSQHYRLADLIPSEGIL